MNAVFGETIDRLGGVKSFREDRGRETRVGWRAVVVAAPALVAAVTLAAGIVVGDDAGGPAGGAGQRQAGEDDSPAAVPATADVDLDDPRQVVRAIADRSAYWAGPNCPRLKTLDYTFLLGQTKRPVTLVKGESRVRNSVWQGCSLRTGMHALVEEPDRFAIEVGRGEAEGTLYLAATVKDAERLVGVEVGNGIDGSWSGYFSHNSRDVALVVDRERLIPLEEKVSGTTLRYREWKEVEPGRWAPGLIDVLHGETRYQMHFDWMGDAVWLLTRAESVSRSGRSVRARTEDVVVNGAAVKRELTDEELRWREAGDVVRRMLDRNRVWLEPGLSAFESIEYTFHTVREDVREACYLNRDRTAVFEVVHDGKEKMGDRLGDRRVALPTEETAYADRESRFAKISGRSGESRGQPLDEALRHYARIGCQLDLPIFRYGERLDGAQVAVEVGDWKGRPCHVARIGSLGGDVYLGAGTMLGFTSWSYVHHVRPEYELVYIDKERHVPIHETVREGRSKRTFEIDFSDYVEVTPGQWAPMSIRIEAKDYFAAEYRFQLVEGKHWLLEEVVSWFEAENKSRGVVADVRVNAPSVLFHEATKQVEASRLLFAGEGADARKQSVAAVPFVLGRRIKAGPYSVLFTFADRSNIAVNVEATDDDAPGTVPLLLLDEQDRALFATHVSLEAVDGARRGSAKLGFSQVLADVRFVVVPGVSTEVGGGHSVPVLPVVWDEPLAINVADQAEGKTRIFEVRVARGEDGLGRAKVSLASHDGPKEFLLDVSAALLDDEGRLVAAGLHGATLRVERGLVQAEHEIDLGLVDALAEADWLVVAVASGNTLSAPMGTLWGSFMRQPVSFPLETLLTADDAGCWRVAVDQLNERLETRKEFFDDLRDRDRLAERGGTGSQVVGPHAGALARMLARIDEPGLLVDVVRLLGHARDARQVGAIRPLLDHADGHVADTAAAALGMLGERDGLDRLAEVFGRRPPSWDEDREARHGFDRLETDAIIALALMGDDASVDLLGETLMGDLGGLSVETDEKGRERLLGRSDRVERVTSILGIADKVRAVGWLEKACRFYEEHEEVRELSDRIPLVRSLLAYEEQTRELVAEQIAGSDFAFIRALKTDGHYNSYYVAAVREMMLDPEKTAWTAHQGVTYLWNVGTSEALAVLREAHDRGMHKDDARTSLYMCEALAALGDDRGLKRAYEALVEFFRDTERPTDKEQERAWENRREWLERGAKDVLSKVRKASIAEFVESQAAASKPAERRALVELLWQLPETPESIEPTLERWRAEGEGEIAEQASRLLQRD